LAHSDDQQLKDRHEHQKVFINSKNSCPKDTAVVVVLLTSLYQSVLICHLCLR